MDKNNTEKSTALAFYSVLIENTHTAIDRMVLDKLYFPLLGQEAYTLYNYFYSLIDEGERESKVFSHEPLFYRFKYDQNGFERVRKILEALGLLDTYFKDTYYLYVLKKVLSPFEFFQNDSLTTLLTNTLGEEEVEHLAYQFLVRNIDANKLNNITVSFDDVFVLEQKKNLNLAEFGAVNTKNNGINIKNKNFDLHYLIILLDSLEIVNKEIINNELFLETIIRYAYLYGLNVEEMKDACIKAATIDGLMDYSLLKMHVKQIFDKKNMKVGYVPKQEAVKADDETIKALDTCTPNDIYQSLFNVGLTSSDIDMFDRLLQDTNVYIGVLNTLVLYVAIEKEGSVLSYQYYRKILNDWMRKGIYTTKDALAFVNGKKETKKNYQTKEKRTKALPSWYQDYKDTTTKEKTKISDHSSKLTEIEEFFKGKH